MPKSMRNLPLYLGGFMGPFGATLVLPMFPELRTSFRTSTETIGWTFTAYLLPFALLLLISGTLGEKWGRKRTVRSTYLLYAFSSMTCALAPNLQIFLLGRSFQGIANAFITPLLLSGSAERNPEAKFGSKVGIYASFQALGMGMAPLIGGISADTEWRAAFWGTVFISILLSIFPPDGEPRQVSSMPSFKNLLERKVILIGFATFIVAAGPMGINVLVAVVARDEFNVSGSNAGLILMGGAFSNFILSPIWGGKIDKIGFQKSSVLVAVTLVVFSSMIAFSTGPITLGIFWALAGGVVGCMSVALQALGATVIPDNRGGGLSFVLSFRFLGVGLWPIIWLPVINYSFTGAVVAASSLGIASAYLLAKK